MTKEDALEKLELEAGASQQEVKQKYQEFYNEFQMRITNAPTTHQKTLYQKKLKQLEVAYILLTGSRVEDTDSDLPGLAPTEIEHLQSQSSTYTQGELSKEQALKLLGLKEPITKDRLEISFREKKTDCENGIQKAINNNIAEEYRNAINELLEAKQILRPFIHIPNKVEATKKNPKPILWVVTGVFIIAAVLFVLKPWEETINPEIEKQFTAIKAQADLLATDQAWKRALEKYEAANNLISTIAIQDSIKSITKRIELLKIDDEIKKWKIAKGANTIDAYGAYLNNYADGKFSLEANNAIIALKKSQAKTLQKEKESIDELIKVSVKNRQTDLPKKDAKIKQYKGLIGYDNHVYDYEGETENNIPHGKGKATYEDGHQYLGDFSKGQMNGHGSLTWSSGNYVGYWLNNQRNGKGTFIWLNGDKYEGNWLNNERTGNGTFTYYWGAKYVGDFMRNKENGYGRYYDKDGDLEYEGQYVDGRRKK